MTPRSSLILLLGIVMASMTPPNEAAELEPTLVSDMTYSASPATTAKSFSQSAVEDNRLASRGEVDAMALSFHAGEAGMQKRQTSLPTPGPTSLSALDTALMFVFSGGLLAYPLVRKHRELVQSSVLTS